MSIRVHRVKVVTALIFVVCCTWSAFAALPVKLSDVVSATDLEAEVAAKLSEIETSLMSEEAFQNATGKLRLASAQLAVLSQALAEHDGDSRLKSAAPSLRDAAIQFGQAKSFDEAKSGLDALLAVRASNGSSAAKLEYDWAKLAKTRVLMDSLRERTDQIRKSLRRSKDHIVESRQASVMAVLALAVAAHADDVKNQSDRPMWNEFSLEFQREMTLTAAAMRRQDPPSVLEHFKTAQAACEKCHEKFKR